MQRELILGTQRLGYTLRRSRRRSIGFLIDGQGLTVTAPLRLAQAELDQAVAAKAGWILRKLAEQRERSQQAQAGRMRWEAGAVLPFLGESLVLETAHGERGVHRLPAAAMAAGPPNDRLRVGVAPGLGAEALGQALRSAVLRWLQAQARVMFAQRCQHFAPLLGVRMGSLRLSSARTRWGSASARGTIALNWRLVFFPLPVLDYVVAHELAHLREMNHSPAFWALVRSVIPDMQARRAELRAPHPWMDETLG